MMDFDELLDELAYNRYRFPKLALKQAIARREEITPTLLDTLELARQDVDTLYDEPDYFLHIYALYLLAQFRERKAYPLILSFFALPGDITFDVTGDVVTEDLGRIVASTFDGNLQLLKEHIENSNVNEYVRSAYLDSLVILWSEGILSRDEVLSYFAHLIDEKTFGDNAFLWTSLISEMLYLSPQEHTEAIKKLIEEEWIDDAYLTFQYAEKEINKSEDEVLADLRDRRHYSLVNDVISEMQAWMSFEPPTPVPSTISDSTRTTSQRKVGRNEPCPCGSGKKYKKCCMRK